VTDVAVRSPWDAVPREFFIIFFLAALSTFAAAYRGPAAFSVPLVAALALLMTNVAALVYAVGYGFDPFIHQATGRAIVAAGEIQPKPLYYVGQYSLIAVLARLTGLSVGILDRHLVPAAFALIVPCAYWSLRRTFGGDPRVAAAASMGVLLLPLSPFIVTTPQGLANTLLLATALLALPAAAAGAFPRWTLALLAAAAAAVHPLAGLPLAVFVALETLYAWREKARGLRRAASLPLLAVSAAVGAVALPAAFALNSVISDAAVSLNVDLLRAPATILEEFAGEAVTTRRFSAVLDTVYSWRAWRETVLLAAGAAGLFLLRGRRRAAAVFGVGFAVFFANYVLLKAFVRFPFLISYERADYADRMFDLALLVAAPAAIAAFGALLLRFGRSFPALKIGAAALVAALVSCSLYLAYPRRDRYESSRGWSTSAADVEAVKRIEADAGGRRYAVLANQSVSAAAVREFGFRNYFPSRDAARPGMLFYYPIPTSSALYEEFLEMNVSGGSAAVARRAMDLVGADVLYFVVNDYWHRAGHVVASAKRQADGWWTVGGAAHVFKYARH
jgi:hypothetical protein